MKQNNFSSSGPILHSSYANYSGFIDKSGKERKQNHQTKINSSKKLKRRSLFMGK